MKEHRSQQLADYEKTEGVPDQGRPESQEQPDRPARKIGPYSIIAEIGRGGMGVVYQAQDVRLGRFVALKFLSPHLSGSQEARTRFLAEARAASALDHPGICTVYDIGESEDGVYIAMAYYDGLTLDTILKAGPLPRERALDIVSRTAEALAHAHDAGIVHRDIKPSNILITSRDEVKILDFGVAKLQQSPSQTQPGFLMGTPAYMSPEQILGEEVDHRTDLWSLGVVLLESLTGINPFLSDKQRPVATSAFRELPALTSLLPGADKDLNAILERALAKRPQDRYSTAAELIEDLQRLRSPGVNGARPPAERASRLAGGNLPVPLSSFIGRQQELERIRNLMPSLRVLTLTGTAGTGKTRLAIEAARQLSQDYQQAFFVPLASVNDADSVPSAIAQSIGVAGSSGKSFADVLRDWLRQGRRLMVLDNFEQVVDAGAFLADLLSNCPDLRLIVTSRTPLHITGEQEFPVPPLNLPDSASLTEVSSARQYPSVALFEERAKAATGSFELDTGNVRAVAELCIRLDGLPLAIELAASRVKLFSPEALLARLGSRLDFLKSSFRDRPARHQTLRQAIAWSYELLDPDHKVFFRRASIFQGGFSVEAASAVVNQVTKLAVDPLDAVFALLDHSLLQQKQASNSQSRVSMLETIREFGLEMLRESGELDPVRQAHGEYYLGLAREADRELTGPNQQEWLERTEQERDNFRLALAWTKDKGEAESEQWLASALWRFWLVQSYVTESFDRLQNFLTRSTQTGG